jgi:WD40 repeat protein
MRVDGFVGSPFAAIALLFGLVVATSVSFAQGPPTIRWQANDAARTLSYSKDGLLIADAGVGVTITLRSAPDGRLVRTIRDRSGINSVAFSPDGTLLADGRTNGSGSNLKIFSVVDGSLVRTLSGHSNATRSVAFSPDGTLLASGGDDRTARLWRVSDGALQRTLADGSRVHSVAFAPDGNTVVSGDQGGSVKLWRVSDGTLLRTLTGFSGIVTQVAVSPDSNLIAASSLDETIRLWGSDGRLVSVLRLPPSTPTGSVTSIAFSPDGTTLVTGNDEVNPSPEHGTLRFYRVSDGALRQVYDRQTDVYVSSVFFSPLGDSFAYARAIDGVLTVTVNPF